MFGIVLKEYLGLIKGVKSFLVILFVTSVSIWAAQYASSSTFLTEASGDSQGTELAGLSFIFILFGALFIYILSHDIVNRDIELQRIRLLITKTSRKNVIVGKFISVFSFWASVTLITFVCISISTQTFYIAPLILLWVFIAFHSGVAIMMSTIITKHSYTVLISLIGGLVIPGVGIWSLFNKSVIAKVLNYALPYYIAMDDYRFIALTVVEVAIMLIISIIVFERKEL
ncbi:ABC-2 type transport system permease protein [Paenibacillus algorifonticola]|uniref:ABC-2 type transport system permease protein n=1 Tax=Paenibacillus algorifonticola TaxID=684063 RepID=A0A1I2HLZ6_9BACL|nr:hypothetical protein [Paenibacillus algorifonticola]SFF29867.1 ABC-2 type transport system permease protein [Paenibacillus algorifonticola]